MPSQRSPRPRVLVAHCYPGGLGGAASRWSHGSRIWLEGLALSAADEVEAISEGTHERVVVTVARFDKRMVEKAARTRTS